MIIGGIIKVMGRMKASRRQHYDITIRNHGGSIRFDIDADNAERPRVKEDPCLAADPTAPPSHISTRWSCGGENTLTPDEA